MLPGKEVYLRSAHAWQVFGRTRILFEIKWKENIGRGKEPSPTWSFVIKGYGGDFSVCKPKQWAHPASTRRRPPQPFPHCTPDDPSMASETCTDYFGAHFFYSWPVVPMQKSWHKQVILQPYPRVCLPVCLSSRLPASLPTHKVTLRDIPASTHSFLKKDWGRDKEWGQIKKEWEVSGSNSAEAGIAPPPRTHWHRSPTQPPLYSKYVSAQLVPAARVTTIPIKLEATMKKKCEPS